jgi:hypothetical protein
VAFRDGMKIPGSRKISRYSVSSKRRRCLYNVCNGRSCFPWLRPSSRDVAGRTYIVSRNVVVRLCTVRELPH